MGGKPSRHRRMREIFMQLKGQKLVDIEKIVKEEDKNSVKLIVKYFHACIHVVFPEFCVCSNECVRSLG